MSAEVPVPHSFQVVHGYGKPDVTQQCIEEMGRLMALTGKIAPNALLHKRANTPKDTQREVSQEAVIQSMKAQGLGAEAHAILNGVNVVVPIYIDPSLNNRVHRLPSIP